MLIIPLERLIKRSFNHLKGKAGSIFIEASLVLPLTCIILITMITMAMSFYRNIYDQVQNHKEEMMNESHRLQMEAVRVYEKIF